VRQGNKKSNMNRLLKFHNPQSSDDYFKELLIDKRVEQHGLMPWGVLLSLITTALAYVQQPTFTQQQLNSLIWIMINTFSWIIIFFFSRKYQTVKNTWLFDILHLARSSSSLILAYTGLSNTQSLYLYPLKFLYNAFMAWVFITSYFVKIIYLLAPCAYIVYYVNGTANGWYYGQLVYQIVILWLICYVQERVSRSSFLEKYKQLKTGDTLKFILDEIPENIVILDKNLKEKFRNKLLNQIFGNDGNVQIEKKSSKRWHRSTLEIIIYLHRQMNSTKKKITSVTLQIS